jgi:uncharacterized protein
MNKRQIIKNTEKYVKAEMGLEDSGHDWWHVYRVWQLAKRIAQHEDGDKFVIELAALLHDISDWKKNSGDSTVGGKIATDFLLKNGANENTALAVRRILENISFKGVAGSSNMQTIEGKIVQDADRLDAMGAIGIGRCFTYGGYRGFPMHDPKITHNKKEFGKRMSKTSINHFYEKLLLLKDLMNTKTGKQMAQRRHKFLEQYLNRFLKEWNGES